MSSLNYKIIKSIFTGTISWGKHIVDMKKWYRLALLLAMIFFAASALLAFLGRGDEAGLPLSLAFLLLAFGIRIHAFFSGFAFTVILFSAITLAMYYPGMFVQVGSFQLKGLIFPLLQVIMFGMGTTMSLNDFLGVLKMPRAVLLGLVCQFTIMPFLGLGLANVFGFPAEIAAGILLVGCSPSGLSSNVMSFIARANVPLSVTLTAVATLLAPLLTPFLMQQLAGQYIQVDFWKMMADTARMVLLPIGAGLMFNHFLHGKAVWLDRAMPLVSMAGIAIIAMVITANGRDGLLQMGVALIAAAALHNTLGYLLGYLGARVFGMNPRDCRTIAIEVGMQNAGLASGLALTFGKIATVGLAPAVFGPLMNITGSCLATWWRNIPLPED